MTRSSFLLSTVVLAGLVLWLGAPQASAADITLRYGSPTPPSSPLVQKGIIPWTERVAKASNGKVEIEVHFQTLGSMTELYKNTREGVADVAFIAASAQRGFEWPRVEVMSLPGVLDGFTNLHANIAMWRLWEKGLLAEDFTDIVPIAFTSLAPTHLVASKALSLEDLAGVKLGVTSGSTAAVAKLLGGIPVFMPATDLYQALDRKTVDAALIGFTGVGFFRLFEVTDHNIVVPLDAPLAFIGVNKAKLDGLPSDAQAALLETSGLSMSTDLGGAVDDLVTFTKGNLAKNPKQNIIVTPPEVGAKWLARTQPIIDQWVATTPNGAAILAAYKAELKAARDGN